MRFEVFYMQILCLGVLILLAHLFSKLTRKLRVREVVGQVIGGLVAGPILLFFLEAGIPEYREVLQSVHFFTFVFLSIIAFGIGDELSRDKLRQVGPDALKLCLIQAFSTWVLISGTFLLLGFEPIIALIIGSIGIATAPASTFVIMNRLGITGRLRNILGSTVVIDDVLEILVFSVTTQAALMMAGSRGVTAPACCFPSAVTCCWRC